MKNLALALVLVVSASAFARSTTDCDKDALAIVESTFGPLAPGSISVVSNQVVSLPNNGTLGQTENVKVVLKGYVKGYVILSHKGEGDQECNPEAIVLKTTK